MGLFPNLSKEPYQARDPDAAPPPTPKRIEPVNLERFSLLKTAKDPLKDEMIFKKLKLNPGIDGAKVREYRHRAGLTQMQASSLSGVRGWGAIELCTGRVPWGKTLKAICEVLGVTPDMIAADGRPVPPAPREPTPEEISYRRGFTDGYAKCARDHLVRAAGGTPEPMPEHLR